MALSNYTNISAKVSEWLRRVGHSSIDTNVEDFIILGQRRLVREVRVPPQEVLTTLTITDGQAAIPLAFLDVKEMIAFDGNAAWDVRRSRFVDVKHKRLQANRRGPEVFDTVGANFEFGPEPTSGVTVQLVYYQELDLISTSVASNWFSTYAPELILYAALVEASVFIKDFEQEAIYDKKYQDAKQLLMTQKLKSEFSGHLQVNNT